MAFTPISNTVPQYEENGIAASGFYIKFYEAGTTTPTAMATDSTGVTLLDKCELNTEGYPINGSSAVFIPHINKRYKIALFRNAADADSNNLANAAWPAVDNLEPVLSKGSGEVATISDLINIEPGEDGQQISLLGHTIAGIGGGVFYYDESDTASADNNGTIIVTTGGKRWKRQAESVVDVAWFGAGQGLGDDSPIIKAAFDYANNGPVIDSINAITTLVGYSDNYILNTSLVLGETSSSSTVQVDIMGVFTTDSSLPFAIKIRHFRNSQVSLGRISPTSNGIGTGLIIENCFGGNIFVAQLGKYKTPINHHGNGSYGFQGCAYYHLKCAQAGGEDDTLNVVELTTESGGYVNSVKTEITGARGSVFSKHTKGVGQTDPYNSNNYVNCGLEFIRLTGFDWDFSSYNHVDHPRLEGNDGVVRFTDGVINESNSVLGSTYDLFVVSLSQVGVMNSESILNARLLDSGGSTRAKQASQTTSGRIIISDRASLSTIDNLTVFTEGDTGATSSGSPLSRYRGFFTDSSGVVHPYGLGTPYSVKRITSYTAGDVVSTGFSTTIDITTDNGALDLRSDANRQFEGFELIINIRVAHTGLTFSSADGSLPIAATAFPTAGIYLIKRLDFRWRASLIGSQFAVS